MVRIVYTCTCPASAADTAAAPARCASKYIGRSDVTVICGHNTVSMSCGNTAYCVQLSGEDLLRGSMKIESVDLRNCPYYHYLTKKVMSQ